MKQPRASVLVVLASVLVLAAIAVGALTIWRPSGSSEVSTFGSRHDAPAASPEVTVSQSPAAAVPPIRIRIPAIGVDSRVIPVGIDKENAVVVPQDIFTIGWYRFGVPPGSPAGSAVLVGHRDGREQGHGALYNLGSLRRGDPIVVITELGDRLAYRVVAREAVSKVSFPQQAADLFAVAGSPRLTLISCGGYYDRNHGGYQDNIVVTAVPT